MGLRRVAGVGLDGSLVTSTFGKLQIPCLKAEYADSLEPAFMSYMGSQQQDEQTPGSYKTENLKLTMSSVVFRTMFMPAMPSNGGGNIRMAVVIGVSHPDLGDDSDLLENCRCINWGAAWENSNKAVETPLEFTIQQIRWTNDRKTINQLNGVVPAGLVGF